MSDQCLGRSCICHMRGADGFMSEMQWYMNIHHIVMVEVKWKINCGDTPNQAKEGVCFVFNLFWRFIFIWLD